MRLTDPQGLVLIILGIRCLNKFHPHVHAVDTDFILNIGLAGNNTQRFFVNKTELIEHIAKHADLSKAAAGRALEATIGAVRTTLKKGGTVSLVGFGTFAVGKRAARTGRNPRTGAAIKIKKANVPKFRPGKGLKDALN
jgi:DNA-binding protein HU-beta